MPENHPSADIYADDLVVGEKYELGHHTVTEEEVVDFASKWDPQPFHIDSAAAASHGFGGLIASGLHTLAIYQRLTVLRVDGRWKAIAGRKIQEAIFVRPVRPNDVLTGSMVITEVSLDDRARGRVTTTAELVNSEGDLVLTVTAVVFLHSRPR
ncbi:MaoC family dehydratase N-terminal domain-containing protein (plasmid) [Rhodococcus sp. USK10]|uniref:MaoC/PaaZ C-terminal domain-containing protein n=1 Tax=Rhodococcus sp. USK10 TaxID=2789739 RepID=UPI001C5CCFF8|nr:MaoC/PaaZ C-terminal domain-containing protein [Rhodococcus sp. USK10]QYA99626.1 MaoC family dehydratase N-terminal domain-containing protein [Rhodococcus sp. USK10]